MNVPRLNIYLCDSGCKVVTVDVDDGTTPFFIDCPKCKHGIAQSLFYPVVFQEPTHEWYIPTPAEFTTLNDGEKEHVALGGLLLRPRTDKAPRYYKEIGTKLA